MGQTATKSGHGDYSAVAELNFCREVDLDGFMRHAMATASGEGPHECAATARGAPCCALSAHANMRAHTVMH